ncbi:MAG: PAS domain S-box protein [Nitrospirae bacterium]|nr:PAS domain S-box protein [Nitrospirota bacterium]
MSYLRNKYIALGIFSLLAIVAAGLLFTYYLVAHAEYEDRQSGTATIKILKNRIVGELSKYEQSVVSLSSSPWIISALKSGGDIEKANSVLDRYNKTFKSTVCFILDLKGMVIMSSNRNSEDSFIGTSVAFRPYYLQALSGGVGRYFALGVTSNKRGYYVSSPVRDDNSTIIGIAVIKKEIDVLENDFRHYSYCFLVDPHGVVFIAGDSALASKSLQPLNREEELDLLRSKQFGNKSFRSILNARHRNGDIISFKDRTFTYLEEPIDIYGWSIVLFASNKNSEQHRVFGLAVTSTLCAVLLIFFFGAIKTERAGTIAVATKEELTRLINAMPDIVFFKDGQGKWLEANDFVLNYFNIDKQRYKGKTDAEIALDNEYYKDAIRRNTGLDEEVWTSGTIMNKEITITHPDGTVTTFDILKTPVFHRDGRRRGLVTIGRDITEKKLMEIERKRSEQTLLKYQNTLEDLVNERTNDLVKTNEELRAEIAERKKVEAALTESEIKYRQLFELTHAGILVIDKNGIITLVNPRMAEMLEYDAQEMTGKQLLQFINAQYINICRHSIERLAQGIRGQMELEFLKKNGKAVYATIETSPIVDDLGRYEGAVAGVIDTTGHKELENQLLQSQKMESIGQLAGGIAHDFNNILSAMTNYGYLLKMRIKDDTAAAGYTAHIQALIERAASLTKSLLVFSRKHIYELKPVNISELVRNIEKLLTRLIGEDIEIKTIIRDSGVMIMADKTHIEMALMNLAANARDAMPEGGALTVELGIPSPDFPRTHGLTGGTRYVYIKISDTGMGMNEDTKAKMFDPFFTTKEVGKGTGLGLSTVYGIVRLHKGHIEAESKRGEGSVFTIYLPVEENIGEEETLCQPTAKMGASETILLSEDDEALRRITVKVLKRAGYKVVEAVDGKDAVEKFIEHKDDIDIVVLDVIMPKKNGKAVYNEIKLHKPNIKVLFISGHTYNVIHGKGVFEEGLNYIAKPIMTDEFLSKIRDILDKDVSSAAF